MSDLLPTNGEDLSWPEGHWTPNDQVRTALESLGPIRNPSVVALALALGRSKTPGPAFIPTSWLGAFTLLVPTAGGVAIRAGRMKVMPVFSDAEAFEAWLPAAAGDDHPCFGPPADGVGTLHRPRDLSVMRAAAGAVTVCLNPAGPGGYLLDPEDGGLDHPFAPPPCSPAPSLDASRLTRSLIEPGTRDSTRARIATMSGWAQDHARAGRCAEAVSTLAAADRLGEELGDYVHRAEMMMFAARTLDRAGCREAAGRLAHYAVLAAGLSARGGLELGATRLRAQLA